jgi:sugar phosphate isomerase/epimerase
MLHLRIAIHTASLREPLRKALVSAAQLGAEAVEIDAPSQLRPSELSQTGRRQLRKMLDDLNLRVAAIGFYTRRGYDAPDDLDRRVAATKEAMQMAYVLGCNLVINQVGNVPSAEALSENGDPAEHVRLQRLVEALTDLGHFADRCGARLAAETGTESGEDLARLLASVPEGSLAVSFDPGNLIINGFSPLKAIHALGPHIAHFHVRDGVRDLARGRGLEVPVGRGTADFPQLLASLEEYDYRGYLSLLRSHCEDPAGEFALAIEYLRNL